MVIATHRAHHARAGFGWPPAQNEAPVAIAAIDKAARIDLQIDQRVPGDPGFVSVTGHAGLIAKTDFLRGKCGHNGVLAIQPRLVI